MIQPNNVKIVFKNAYLALIQFTVLTVIVIIMFLLIDKVVFQYQIVVNVFLQF